MLLLLPFACSSAEPNSTGESLDGEVETTHQTLTVTKTQSLGNGVTTSSPPASVERTTAVGTSQREDEARSTPQPTKEIQEPQTPESIQETKPSALVLPRQGENNGSSPNAKAPIPSNGTGIPSPSSPQKYPLQRPVPKSQGGATVGVSSRQSDYSNTKRNAGSPKSSFETARGK